MHRYRIAQVLRTGYIVRLYPDSNDPSNPLPMMPNLAVVVRSEHSIPIKDEITGEDLGSYHTIIANGRVVEVNPRFSVIMLDNKYVGTVGVGSIVERGHGSSGVDPAG